MKTSFSINGLHDPSTKIELGGSVYFMRNPMDHSYEITHACIDFGKLSMSFEPLDRSCTDILADRFFIKLEPGKGMVGLRIKTVEELDANLAEVSIYVVESVIAAGGFPQFCVHKWSLVAPPEFAENVNLNCSEEDLLLSGFKSVMDRVVDSFEKFTFYPVER